ncbi:hypothetical protein ACJRO7_004068 [Eucalyptus globulus]|uniref:Membrane-associated kinase regulator 4 n=1 Tax=Eucalyptus globulus TaxID=34317 RepID=A0ABD3IYU0_EUCGL
MDMNPLSPDHADDDYIDMEVSSYSNFLSQSVASPQHPREFEFQMSSISLEKETTTSPADELFYKGKLLPLHLPPCLEMVEKFLQHSNPCYADGRNTYEEHYSTPLVTNPTTPTTMSTPFESCNISPSESCRVSRELTQEEYISEYFTETGDSIRENPKKSWTRKIKLIKQSSLGSKLKASRAYIKSLFGKSGCSDDTYAGNAKAAGEESTLKDRDYSSNCEKVAKKNPFGQIYRCKNQSSTSLLRRPNEEKRTDNGVGGHRRSFSVSIKWHSPNKISSSSSSSKSSSSSFSKSSNGFNELQFLKRSSSVKSEMESPIQGAIAHCKRSQQFFHSRKTDGEVGFLSLSTSRISVSEDHEKISYHLRG